MSYRLIVFDWDGTIIDSAATIAECIRDSARDMKLPVPSLEQASHVIGLGLHDSLRMAVPELQAHQYPAFVANYRRHFLAREDSMGLFPGMKELLTQLSTSRSLAIATGKSRRGLDRALAATGIGPLFSASRCADETNPKPHPAMLLELMDELGFSKNQILMIGDTSHISRWPGPPKSTRWPLLMAHTRKAACALAARRAASRQSGSCKRG